MRHFYFNSGPIPDEPAAILEQIEKCFAELAKHKEHFAYIRQPPKIVRENSFDSDKTLAWVVCRMSITDDSKPFSPYLKDIGALALGKCE